MIISEGKPREPKDLLFAKSVIRFVDVYVFQQLPWSRRRVSISSTTAYSTLRSINHHIPQQPAVQSLHNTDGEVLVAG